MMPHNTAKFSGDASVKHLLFRRRGSPPRTIKVSGSKSDRDREDAKLVDNLPPIPPPDKRPIP